MKKIIPALLIALIITACSTVPLTGRKQLSLVSDSEILSLSNQSFQEYMKTAQPSTNKQNTAMVVRVGTRIANAVETYLNSIGRSEDVKEFAWEFHLVQDSTANAFCMPGGKIVVNEGILPYTQNEAGLAIVLGHEVAHAVAKHSKEQMSEQLLLSAGGVALGLAVDNKSEQMQQLAQTVYGLGSSVGVTLPHSRKNESEADHLGLIFAAMAGYDPHTAVGFWQRMAQGSGGGSALAFLSTHPSNEKRIRDIEKLIPEAMKYYKPGGVTPGTSSTTGNSSPTGNNPAGKNNGHTVKIVNGKMIYE